MVASKISKVKCIMLANYISGTQGFYGKINNSHKWCDHLTTRSPNHADSIPLANTSDLGKNIKLSEYLQLS